MHDNNDNNGLTMLLLELREWWDAFVDGQRGAMADMMRDACRRMSLVDVISRQKEEAWRVREGRERTRLKGLYAKRQGGGQVALQQGGGGHAMGGTIGHDCKVGGGWGGQGIPVLDILSRPPVYKGPTLLVGGTLTLLFTDLTLCQQRALEVAILNHNRDKGERTLLHRGGDARCGADPVFGGCVAATAPLMRSSTDT